MCFVFSHDRLDERKTKYIFQGLWCEDPNRLVLLNETNQTKNTTARLLLSDVRFRVLVLRDISSSQVNVVPGGGGSSHLGH